MRHLIFLVPLSVALLGIAQLKGTLIAADPDSGSVKVSLRAVASADAQPRPMFPRLLLTLRKDRPANAGTLPKLSAAGRYASVRAGGRDLVLAFDAPAGSFALGNLLVGSKPAVNGRARPVGKGGFRIEFDNVLMGGARLNVWLDYRGSQIVDSVCEPSHHRRGKVVFEGDVRTVILVDGDGDGRYDGEEDRWIALKSDRTRRFSSLRKPAMSRLSEPQIPFAENGMALMVREVAQDGSTLLLVRGKPRVALANVLARRYAEFRAEHFREFRRERESFQRRAHLDSKRPRTTKRALWPRISLEEAKARAKQTGRPLLVAYYTETNAWWWRYLYYTFPDREVDRLLRQFVRTAIDAEKGGADAYQKSGAKSLPALQAFLPNGRAIAFRFRSRDKTGKVRDLEITTAGVSGWLTPQDLVVNLNRMLKASGTR